METLGVYMVPNGSQREQIKSLERKIVEWYTIIKARKMPIEESWLYMNITIMKTIEYLLLTTVLSRKECYRLLKQIYSVILLRAGICRVFPNALKYSPKNLIGLGLTDIYLL